MKRHGTPDCVLTLPHIKLPLYDAVSGDSDFAESHLEGSDSPHIQEFPDACSAPSANDQQVSKRDLQSKIVPPTLTAGQLLGSSRLITKLRTHAGRVSRAGQGRYPFWSIVNVESALCTIKLSKERQLIVHF